MKYKQFVEYLYISTLSIVSEGAKKIYFVYSVIVEVSP